MTTSDHALQAVETLEYVKKFSGHSILVKLGGVALEDSKLLKALCEDLVLLRASGLSVVLVHGGGTSINEELTRNQIKWSFIEGQRVTTPEMMDIIEMVLCGKMNRRVVRALNAAGVNSVGVSGSDEGLFLCKRLNPDLGEVGKVEKVKPDIVNRYLVSQAESGKGTIPVVAPVGVDAEGKALNVNADWAAMKLAHALSIKKMIYMTGEDGILDGQGKLLSELDAEDLTDLIQNQVVSGGMLAKVRTILEALASGVSEIHIINARRPKALIEELFTKRGSGTICVSRSRVRAV